jgi:hypothetical protein
MLALALGVAAALWLGRSISRPLLTLDRSVQAIAAESVHAIGPALTRRLLGGVLALELAAGQRVGLEHVSLEIVTSAATELDSTARVMTQVADGTNGQALASSAAPIARRRSGSRARGGPARWP